MKLRHLKHENQRDENFTLCTGSCFVYVIGITEQPYRLNGTLISEKTERVIVGVVSVEKLLTTSVKNCLP